MSKDILKVGDIPTIIEQCRAYGVLRNQVAYVLATVIHETSGTAKPIRERGGEKYLRSKKYYPYVGMGYVQLTWDYNYKKAGDKLGVDFLKNPKLLLEPKYAVPILIVGMLEGWFTGKKLSDYITLQKSDFKGARRIVNGTDKADLIAGYAREYDAALKVMGYGEETTPIKEPEKISHSKRFWTWLTAAALPALGLLDWRVQLTSVVVVGGIAAYAIYSMPSVKDKISKLVDRL